MSIGSYHLRPQAFYPLAVPFSMERFRALLRKEREHRVGGREKLAQLADVHKTTIQNIEVGPDMPGIETVAKLIESMPGMSLSEFFGQLEQKNLSASQKTAVSRDTQSPASTPKGLPDHGPTVLRQAVAVDPDRAIADAYRQLADAYEQRGLRPPPLPSEKSTDAVRKKPGRRKRGA